MLLILGWPCPYTIDSKLTGEAQLVCNSCVISAFPGTVYFRVMPPTIRYSENESKRKQGFAEENPDYHFLLLKISLTGLGAA